MTGSRNVDTSASVSSSRPIASLSVALLLISATGCKPTPPTDASLRDMVEAKVQSITGTLAHVARFSHGPVSYHERSMLSSGYDVAWHVTLAFTAHSVWCYPFFVRAYDRRYLATTPGAREVQSGDTASVTGLAGLIYEDRTYTDEIGNHFQKGWRLEEGGMQFTDGVRGCT